MKRVVVLGGGVGGLTVAKELRRRLKGKHGITVVDKSPVHYFAPSLPWLIMGWRKPEQISRSLLRLLGPGVDFVQGQVQRIDTSLSQVTVNGNVTGYDYLVVALGADLAYDSVPELFSHAYAFYDLEHALRLRDALTQFQGGRVVVMMHSTPYKCPAAPYECALLVDYWLKKRGLRTRSEVAIYTPEPQPMPSAGPSVSTPVQQFLEARGVQLNPGHRFQAIDAQKRELTFQNSQATYYDLLIAIPPHACPQVLKDSGLTDERGWVPVDRHTLKCTKSENVYALGDATVIPLASGLPLPKAGVFAHRHGRVVAANVAAQLAGDGRPEQFNGEGS